MSRFSPESLRTGAEDSAERAKGRKPVQAKQAAPALALDDAHGWTNPNDRANDSVLLVIAVELFQRIPAHITGEELRQAVALREQLWRVVMRRAQARRRYHIDERLGCDEDVFCEACLHGDPTREGSVVCRGAVEPPPPLVPFDEEERQEAAEQRGRAPGSGRTKLVPLARELAPVAPEAPRGLPPLPRHGALTRARRTRLAGRLRLRSRARRPPLAQQKAPAHPRRISSSHTAERRRAVTLVRFICDHTARRARIRHGEMPVSLDMGRLKKGDRVQIGPRVGRANWQKVKDQANTKNLYEGDVLDAIIADYFRRLDEEAMPRSA